MNRNLSSLKNYFVLILVAFTFQAYAQTPAIQWQKCIGGSLQEAAASVEITSDGGYVIAGYTSSNDSDVTGNHGGSDFWVTRLDNSGSLLWQKCLGGSNVDNAYAIRQTSDNGYIVAGATLSNNGDVSGNHGGLDGWLVKLDSLAGITWQICLGGTSSDVIYDVNETTGGGYIVAGTTYSNNGNVSGNHGSNDYWVVKLTSAGAIDWQKCLGGTGSETAFSIKQTSDNGYILTGNSDSRNGDVTGLHFDTLVNPVMPDIWTVKLNSSGAITWQKCLGGLQEEGAYEVEQTTTGTYIVAGFAKSNDGNVTGNHGGSDYWLLKLSSSGNLTWQKSFGGTNEEKAFSVQPTLDGGYISAGFTESNNGNVTGNHGTSDLWVLKTSSTGSIQWKKCLGGSDVEYLSLNKIFSVKQLPDESFITVGVTASDNGDVSGLNGDKDVWAAKLTADCLEKPTNLSTINITTTSAKAKWDIIPGVISYQVQYRAVGTTTWLKVSTASNIGSRNMTGLTPGTDYEWKVRAKCIATPLVWSYFSAVQNFTTLSLREENVSEALANAEPDFDVNIFPNPASEIVNVDVENTNNIISLSVVNAAGQIVFENSIRGNDGSSHLEIDVQNLPIGIYYLRIADSSGIINRKIVIVE